MFKCKMKQAPLIFHKLYTLKGKNKYTTRSTRNLEKPIFKTKLSQFCISYRGPHLWNLLVTPSNSLSEIEYLPLFKRLLKRVVK